MTRVIVAQGYSAVHAVPCGNDIRTLASARHAGFNGDNKREELVFVFVSRILLFIFVSSDFISFKLKLKLSLQSVENPQNFVLM